MRTLAGARRPRVGGIVWNLLTWLLGILSSSSHAIGGIVALTPAVGLRGVIWSESGCPRDRVPAVVAALLATLVGAVGTWLVYLTTRLPKRCGRNAVSGAGPDRLGVVGLSRHRHQRRAEDDGRGSSWR